MVQADRARLGAGSPDVARHGHAGPLRRVYPSFFILHPSLARFAARKPLGAVGGAIVLAFVLAAAGAPWLAPYPYDVGSAVERLQGPTAIHPFGTDANGRDMLS